MHPFCGFLLLCGISHAYSDENGGEFTAKNATILPGTYIVEFSADSNRETFYEGLKIDGIKVTPRVDLNFTLFRGASFRLADTDQEHRTMTKIASMTAVKNTWPVRRYPIPDAQVRNTISNVDASISIDTSTVNTSDGFSTHVMTQVSELHALGYTGNGTRIGIVDTGIDYLHPALGGCFGKNCLIGYGYDLVGDHWTTLNDPIPDPDPYDNCQGHGTHVSGIAAAQPNVLNFTGVAPGATLGMYRVFSCQTGSTSDDILISAFNMAYEDGSDIITASIGQTSGWSELPWSAAVTRIVEAGTPCILAAGNDGQDGLFTANNAADGDGVISVASFDNIMTPYIVPKANYIKSSPGGSLVKSSFGWLPGTPRPFSNVTMPLKALSNDASVKSDACSTLPTETPDISGHAILIRLGGCETAQKAQNAAAKGAGFIIFYADETEELTQAYLYNSEGASINVNGSGTVTAEQGAEWIEALNSGHSIQLSFVSPAAAESVYMQTRNTITGGFASTYTSWGPTLDMNSYPTVGAPGGNILSTYLLKDGGYAVLSGTSMATPFVAATYALVQEVRKRRGDAGNVDVATLLCSTSQARLWNDGTGTLNNLAPVPQQGPGLLQTCNAAFMSTLLTIKSISFNDTDHMHENVTFTLENSGSETITYTLGNVPAVGMYTLYSNELQIYSPGSFPNLIVAASAGLNFSQDLVSLAPNERALITVTPCPPGFCQANDALYDELLPIYSGYITINGSNGDDLTIPYMGLAGSLYQAKNVDPTKSSMLGCDSEGHDYICHTTTRQTYTVPYPTSTTISPEYLYPNASITVDLGSALIRADVIPMWSNYSGSTMTVLGNKTAGSVYGFPRTYVDRFDAVNVRFTGMLADGTVVPAGEYALAVRSLKLFGNPDEVGDYNTLGIIPFMLHYSSANTSVRTLL